MKEPIISKAKNTTGFEIPKASRNFFMNNDLGSSGK
jgi:hypothetical protein